MALGIDGLRRTARQLARAGSSISDRAEGARVPPARRYTIPAGNHQTDGGDVERMTRRCTSGANRCAVL